MFVLPQLPYAYNALEPYIDEATMQLHHQKHHQAYVDKLNKALEGQEELLDLDIYELMRRLDDVPENIRTTVRNNGGGHANHTFFWEIMGPETKGPEGRLAAAINDTFGSQDALMQQFNEAGVAQFGSGWVWLCWDNQQLHIETTPNQDNPWMKGHTPILGADVWEHAYYLKYQNRRPDYLNEWWSVVNWGEVAKRFEDVS